MSQPRRARRSLADTPLLLSTLLVASLLGTVACGDDTDKDTPDALTADAPSDANAPTDVGDVTDADAAPDPDAVVDAGADVDTFTPLTCPSPESEPRTFPLGEWTVTAGTDGRWAVTAPHGDTVMRGLPTCTLRSEDESERHALRVGTGTPGLFYEVGAFDIEIVPDRNDTVNNPPEIAWSVPVSTAVVDGSADRVTLRWQVDASGTEVALVFAPDATGNLSVAVDAPGFEAHELHWEAGAEESYFGLGTQVFGMDLRGGTYPLWTQEQGLGKPLRNYLLPVQNIREAAYAPMGIWHSSAGHSAIVGQDGYQELDLAEAESDAVVLRTYPEPPSFTLVRGAAPRDRLEAITAFTGRLHDVPDWVFGPWNDAVGGPERLTEVATILRNEGIPSSAIWSEDWIGGEQTPNGFRLTYAWEWDPGTYPTLPADIDALHADGFAFLGYFNPFVPNTTRMWTEGSENGWLITDADGEIVTFPDPAFRTASLVDLTNPEAVAWVQAYIERAAGELGLDGWMADFAEWYPLDAVPLDGASAWTVHNQYPLMWQRVNRAAMEAVHTGDGDEPANNWTYFARSGWASTSGGTGGIAPIVWGGDQDTDWEADDGYPSIVPIAIHAGLSGVGLFATDIAGYTSVFSPNTNKELFLRWSTVGAMHPVMRTHHGSDKCGNWSFDRDPETIPHYRRWASIHAMLLPVWRALEADARSVGLPAMRHPYLVEPDVRALWTTAAPSFFVGDDLLVAPVFEEGATTRDVVLPTAGWWPWFETSALTSDTATVDAVATELPVFVRPGVAMLLLPRAPDSFYGATNTGVTTLTDLGDARRVALYPDTDGAISERVIGVGDEARTLRATGLSVSFDSSLTINGAPAVPCVDPSSIDCFDPTTGLVRLAAGEHEIRQGDATVGLSSVTGPTELGFAGDAWGEWVVPTLLTDVDPDVPPPCEL